MSFPLKWVSRSIIIIIVLGAFLILHARVERHPISSLYFNIYLFNDNNEKLLYTRTVQDDEKVILSYIHSSDLTPVKQVFRVNENESLELLEERYRWYGAGLEYGSAYDVIHEDGWVVITGYDRSFEVLPIRVAATVNQTIKIGPDLIVLSELASPGSSLFIKVEVDH